MYIRSKMMVIDAIKEKNVNLNSFLFAHSGTFIAACKTFSECLFMTLRRLIYKNNLRQENNGAVCSMMFEIIYKYNVPFSIVSLTIKILANEN